MPKVFDEIHAIQDMLTSAEAAVVLKHDFPVRSMDNVKVFAYCVLRPHGIRHQQVHEKVLIVLIV